MKGTKKSPKKVARTDIETKDPINGKTYDYRKREIQHLRNPGAKERRKKKPRETGLATLYKIVDTKACRLVSSLSQCGYALIQYSGRKIANMPVFV
jgi:hypothetical protein